MLVYKFGGASLATPEAIQAVMRIIAARPAGNPMVVVVSALGKTTNALEHLLHVALHDVPHLDEAFNAIAEPHIRLAETLLGEASDGLTAIRRLLGDLETLVHHLPGHDYDVLYDTVIPYGEMLSSLLLARYLGLCGEAAQWVDVRAVLRSDSVHRAATVQLPLSEPLVRQAFSQPGTPLYITQGFIASGPDGSTTTLGREGSDYTAALLGAFLGADSVTIWKDVPGFLTADPKLFPAAQRIGRLDYREAIEMAYSGAKIVHPKAIKPLENASIPLFIRPFGDPSDTGTQVARCAADVSPVTLFALREAQVLLSITPHDFSFALQDALGEVFRILQAHHVRPHLIQTSALSLSLCVDDDAQRLPELVQALQPAFRVTFNTDLVLLAVRHYTPDLDRVFAVRQGLILCQLTRTTAHYLMRRSDWQERYYSSICEMVARTAAH